MLYCLINQTFALIGNTDVAMSLRKIRPEFKRNLIVPNGWIVQTVYLISNGQNGGNQTFSVMYNATPGFAYPAGTYTVDVVYTATQQ